MRPGHTASAFPLTDEVDFEITQAPHAHAVAPAEKLQIHHVFQLARDVSIAAAQPRDPPTAYATDLVKLDGA